MENRTHRIRLHGPWDVIPEGTKFSPSRMKIPGTLHDGGFHEYTGTVTFLRAFGKPTKLQAGDKVWLVFESIVGTAEVHINGDLLGVVDSHARFDVKDQLLSRNAIAVHLEATDDRCGIVGDVGLEIVSAEKS